MCFVYTRSHGHDWGPERVRKGRLQSCKVATDSCTGGILKHKKTATIKQRKHQQKDGGSEAVMFTNAANIRVA